MSNTSLFVCRDLKFTYRLGNALFPALRGLSAEIPSGKITALAGPSGSGKSTLLHLLGLIEPVQTGNLLYGGQEFSALNEGQKNHFRRFDMGFVFQQFFLFDTLSALENVEYFLKNQNLGHAERLKRSEAALTAVGLADHLKKKPNEMSGGQRQRVAIARALVKNPKVILADEPTASLDQKTGREVMELLKAAAERGTTIIVASHDPMALSFADNIIYIQDGLMAPDKAGGGG